MPIVKANLENILNKIGINCQHLPEHLKYVLINLKYSNEPLKYRFFKFLNSVCYNYDRMIFFEDFLYNRYSKSQLLERYEITEKEFDDEIDYILERIKCVNQNPYDINEFKEFPRKNYNKILTYKEIEFCFNEDSFDISLLSLKNWLKDLGKMNNLDLQPNFKKKVPWKKNQKISYLENLFKYPCINNTLIFNAKDYNTPDTLIQCIDGTQRINATLDFIDEKIPIFGSYIYEISGKLSIGFGFKIKILNFKTEQEMLEWYLEVNENFKKFTKKDSDEIKQLINFLKLEGKNS